MKEREVKKVTTTEAKRVTAKAERRDTETMTTTMIIAKKIPMMNSVIVMRILMILIAFVTRTLMIQIAMTRKAKEDTERREREDMTTEVKRVTAKAERRDTTTATTMMKEREVKKVTTTEAKRVTAKAERRDTATMTMTMIIAKKIPMMNSVIVMRILMIQ